MDPLIITCLGLLGLLAVFDLYVGVSNDAVNFVNSAVGSRTAPFYVIMAVASAGVLAGATFSSGMMEIAKSGVLVPSQFTFTEVLIIFSAVMVTDVLLLNVFNSLGLPTSTTVSIVFELLGGTMALACLKVWTNELPITDLALYVNSAKALSMIMAILVSVVVAFVAGLVVQFVMRLLFTFNYARAYRILGGLFGALCMTAIVYFLVMKGAKGASFMTPEMLEWLKTNNDPILLAVFGISFLLMQGAILLKNANIFPFVILAGTFSLAFAFAGNDLVNFVGVPLAALDAWHIFSAAEGADPSSFMMGQLAEPTTASSMWLLLSGVVMVGTLWISKKARRVIITSVKLSSSSRGGKEQFGSSLPARVLVRTTLHASSMIQQFLPASLLRGLGSRYVPRQYKPGEIELPFDEIRATVNLVLAAALIASATSLKLPLSTTYVTFMVAMGSSLADGAWDRESAVYRVSGVLTVISGWFLTAFSAATACGIVTILFLWGGTWLMIAGMVVACALLVKSNFFTKEEGLDLDDGREISEGNRDAIFTKLEAAVRDNVRETLNIASGGIEGLLNQDVHSLRRLKSDAVKLFDKATEQRGEYYTMSTNANAPKADRDARNFYYRACTNMKEVAHELRDQIGVSENYVANSHSAMTGSMAANLGKLAHLLRTMDPTMKPDECRRVHELIDEAQNEYLAQFSQEKISLRKSELFLGKLIFTREMLNRFSMVKFLLAGLEEQREEGLYQADADRAKKQAGAASS